MPNLTSSPEEQLTLPLLFSEDCAACDGYGSYYDPFFGQDYPCETCGGIGQIYRLWEED